MTVTDKVRRLGLGAVLTVVLAAVSCWGGSSETPDPDPIPTPTSTVVPTPTAAVLWQPPVLPRDTPPTPKPTRTPEPTVVIVPIATPTVTSGSKSVAFTATLDLPVRFTESGVAVAAQMTGWLTFEPDAQIFMQIDLTRPASRSFEILLSNSFDVYLKDVRADQWYLLPENSDAGIGPLEDIVSAVLMSVLMSTENPTEGYDLLLEPVEGGYRWMAEDPEAGAMILTYNTEYQLVSFSLTTPDGHEAIRVTLFGHDEQYPTLTPPDRATLPGLPADYWDQP